MRSGEKASARSVRVHSIRAVIRCQQTASQSQIRNLRFQIQPQGRVKEQLRTYRKGKIPSSPRENRDSPQVVRCQVQPFQAVIDTTASFMVDMAKVVDNVLLDLRLVRFLEEVTQ